MKKTGLAIALAVALLSTTTTASALRMPSFGCQKVVETAKVEKRGYGGPYAVLDRLYQLFFGCNNYDD